MTSLIDFSSRGPARLDLLWSQQIVYVLLGLGRDFIIDAPQ